MPADLIKGVARDISRLLIPAAILAAVMVGLGLLLTKVLPDTGFGAWDAELPRRLVGEREGGEVPESLVISMLSATPTIVGSAIVAFIAFRLMFGRWRESLLVTYAVAGEALIFTITTLFVDRPRPDVPHLDAAPPTSSFPSGHTAAAVCFYGALAAVVIWHTRARWLHVLVTLLAAAAPLMIAGSRVYRGMHYPTDVLAGLLLGAIWLTVVIAYLTRQAAQRSPRDEHRHSGARDQHYVRRGAVR
jgi:membrane-associated phospholipid phosphatase